MQRGLLEGFLAKNPLWSGLFAKNPFWKWVFRQKPIFEVGFWQKPILEVGFWQKPISEVGFWWKTHFGVGFWWKTHFRGGFLVKNPLRSGFLAKDPVDNTLLYYSDKPVFDVIVQWWISGVEMSLDLPIEPRIMEYCLYTRTLFALVWASKVMSIHTTADKYTLTSRVSNKKSSAQWCVFSYLRVATYLCCCSTQPCV